MFIFVKFLSILAVATVPVRLLTPLLLFQVSFLPDSNHADGPMSSFDSMSGPGLLGEYITPAINSVQAILEAK